MTNNQLAIVDALKANVAKMQGEFAKSLPGHIKPEKFVRTTQTAISMTRNIDKVKDMGAFLAACTNAAADGLILDGREAALVVDYNGGVQYRPMMRGLLKLAYNSGMVKSLVVELVRENDSFDYSPTRADEPIFHTINLKTPRGEAYAAYAIAAMKDGGVIHEVMSVEDINAIRDRSDAYRAFKAGKIKSTPWSTDWSEMARKTVFRRLSKYLPSSTDRDEFHQAVERIDEDFTFDPEEPAPKAAATTKKRGAGAAALKDVTPSPATAPAQQDNQPQDDDAGDYQQDYDAETGEVLTGEIVDGEMQKQDDI